MRLAVKDDEKRTLKKRPFFMKVLLERALCGGCQN